MQVLLFVFSILMAMSLMTYQRVAGFRELSALRHEYSCYMENVEHYAFNEAQIAQYEAHKGKGSSKNESDKAIQASRYLNIQSLFEGSEKEKNFQTQYNLLSKLIVILYSKKPFYREMEIKRPDFVRELLNTMIQAGKTREPKISHQKTLANLELHDAALQDIYAKMLSGNNESKKGGCGAGTEEDDYDSLLNYLRVKKTVNPIRIQLAPKALLLAIYEDPALVDNMLNDINRLRQSVESNKEKKTEASLEFERLYKDRLPRDLDPSLFNFSITSTKR